ncbi:pregnancy zone protein-like isoform X2 [Zophobas morio]|uniref:pregnancy zone protein-like isoform X2 n=1 Tax=Zophobas morio TaxID=2755281 RepID=UPI00308379AF
MLSKYSYILLLVLHSAKFETTFASENVKKTVPGFIYSMPKTLTSGQNETVCFSAHHLPSEPITVVVDLKFKNSHFITTKIVQPEHSCFEVQVPVHGKNDPDTVGVKVQVHANGVVYFAHNQDPVLIVSKKMLTFIETDRFIYKSEDTVKLRILSLENNMLPTLNSKIPYVRLRNPAGIGVMTWQNISSDLGLAHIEYKLPQNSRTGIWKFESSGQTKTFEVTKYTLPRFKVYILHPRTIYYKALYVNITVCAKYSFGAPVKGTAFIRLSDAFYNIKTIQVLKKMTDGCTEFRFLQEDLSLENIKKKFPLIDPRIRILITATVTEDETDKIELTTAKSLILLKPYSLKFIKNDIFLPGLTYHGVIQLSNINIDLIGEVIEICYNIAIRKSWNYLNNEQCSNITLSNQTFIQFHILPLRNNVIHLQLSARSLSYSDVADNLLVVRMYSPSGTYIKLESVRPLEISKCRSVQQFYVEYTTNKFKENENLTFYYMIKTSQGIHKMKKILHTVHKTYPNYTEEYETLIGFYHKHTKLDNSIDKFILKFRLDEKIFSNYQILFYYVGVDGEIVTATREIDVDPCLLNDVKANWSHKQIIPGGTASLLLEAKSDSLCSVSVTDKSVKFMNDVNVLNTKTLIKSFLQEQEYPESKRRSCLQPKKKSRDGSNNRLSNSKREKRFIYSFSEDYDAYDVFNKFEIITISNFKVVSKPCYTGQFLTDQYSIQNEDRGAPIRSFFPDTWLWELVPVRNVAVIHRTLPHTITTWETSVLCVSAIHGPGISKISEITSFQPFFINLLTPYSVKLGEILYLHTIVFNYLTYNVPIRISLAISDGLDLLDAQKRTSFSYCVHSNNTVTHVFEVKAVKAQKVNVTVVGELDPSFPGHCGPDTVVNKRDVVFKTFIVEPEGYPVQITKSALFCRSDDHSPNNVTWDALTPNDVVLDTFKTEIILHADILGQSIENFDELIIMPTGCGEQIMATLAPNLYVLRYLNATRSLSTSVTRRIIRNLKIGYQRILNYVHSDGSFSAFGYYDSTGSMFLTAFVVRILQDIKQYIYVDQKIIDRAVTWIISNQLENGCFKTMSHVFQDMGGTTFENSTAGLTAYVMVSLLNANIRIPDAVQTNAKYCIRGHYNLDTYTLAISSYALFKINWYSEANRMLKKLIQISNKKGNMMWWTSKEYNGSGATDVEITSYVLLSLLHQKSPENLAKAHSIVQWLSTQRGPRGGFLSTQDTVVALEALTKYSSMMRHKTTNLNISVKASDQQFIFKFNEENRLISQNTVLKKANSSVEISIHGQGCILTQAVHSYFVKHITSSESFKLDVEILPLSKIDRCSIATISTCFSYNGTDHQSNMAVLEIDLPTGYEADRTSLYKLVEKDKTTGIKMFEEIQQKIVFYVTKLTSNVVCANFDINEIVTVHSRAKSAAKLYDYYKPEFRVLQFYDMDNRCTFKNYTIPLLDYRSVLENDTNRENPKRGI